MATEKEFLKKLKEIKGMLDEGTPIQFNLHDQIRRLDLLIESILKEAE